MQVNAAGQQPVHMRDIAVEFGIYRSGPKTCACARAMSPHSFENLVNDKPSRLIETWPS